MCTPSSTCPPLAVALRAGTKASPELSEKTAFVKCMIRGIVTKASLRQLLANLYFIYDALEQKIRNHAEHPVVSVIHFPRLERSQALEKDLEFYYGSDWRNQIQPSRQTIRYVMRIHAISNDAPALLVAHAYVRYMGDLSGGQLLKTTICSALALTEGRGTAYYDFKGLPTAAARQTFKIRYRDALNMVPVDADLAIALIEEANVAFKFSQAVLKEIEPQLKATVGEQRWKWIIGEDPSEDSAVHQSGGRAGERAGGWASNR